MTLTKAGTQHLNAFNNSILKTQKSLKKTNVNGLNLTTKPDSFEKKPFNVDSAIDSLRKLKDPEIEDWNRFEDEDLMILKDVLTKTPEKWNDIKALVNNKNIDGSFIAKVTSKNEADKLHQITLYANVETDKQESKYTEKALLLASNSDEITTDILKKMTPFTSTMLSLEDILEIGLTRTGDIPPISAILDKVTNLEKTCKGGCRESEFSLEPYSDGETFSISAKQKDCKIKTILTDKNLNTFALEKTSYYPSKNGGHYKIRKVKDLRTGIISKIRSEFKDNGLTVTHEIRVHKDKNGKTIKTEYTQPSEIPSVFNIKYKYPNGKVEVVSEGTINKKTGTQSVIKNMTSLDGTKTEYKYEDTPNGERIMDYKIIDKNGNVLLKKGATFEVVKENKFISSKNDDKYEINIDKKGVHVKGITHPDRKADFIIDKEIQGDKNEILKSLKQMPGEELIKLSKNTKILVGTSCNSNGSFNNDKKEIVAGSDLFTLLHEAGHAIDLKDLDTSSTEAIYKTQNKLMCVDKKFNKIYQEEKNAFIKEFSTAQREYIDYFLKNCNANTFAKQMEVIAESNALLSTCKSLKETAIRVQYLQQYFPRTIAYISTKIDKEG